MKKRILHLLLTIGILSSFVAIMPITANALTEGYYTYTVTDGKATITDFNNSVSGDIVIPDTLGGYPVTAIGDRAFEECTGLTSISLSDNVTSIGDGAFFYCSNLITINISDSVTSIGNYVFSGCNNLTNITVDKNNCYFSSIDGNLFNKDKTKIIKYAPGKKNISYIIPTDVTTIGDGAFSFCRNLTSISIPNNVTNIGNAAFLDCLNLDNITIPDGPTSIGDESFYNCRSLTSISIPYSVTSIGVMTFENCVSLTSITIPNSVTSIGDGAFSYCESLTNIILPNNMTSIGDAAFNDCFRLTAISIPDGVTTISNGTFYNCRSLTSITIPNSVTSIGDFAFLDCTNLKNINYRGTPEEWRNINIGNDNECLTFLTIHYQPYTKTSTIYGKSYKIYQVTSKNTPTGSKVILSCYKGDKLSYIESRNVSDAIFAVFDNIIYDNVKVFVWDGYSGLMPVTEPEIVSN